MIAAAILLSIVAPSWQIGPFTRPVESNPLIEPRPASTFPCPILGKPVHWEELHTFNPAAAVYRDKVYLLYRAEDASGEMMVGGHTSRIGLATSSNGLAFTRETSPVLYPANDDQKSREWSGGCEDPRLVQAPDGRFIVMYTQYNRKEVRLAVASSRDLRHWTKYGPAFSGTTFAELNCKSGCIVSEIRNGHLVAAKIGKRYAMFWGEGSVHLATSEDLIHWTPATDKEGKLEDVLPPRKGCFDSSLAEAGAAAIKTKAGIVVFYNGKNATDESSDRSLPSGAYCGGQALFDRTSPMRLLDRPDKPFFKPEMPWEKTGQYKDGTTFVEGLVRFHDRWLLYYGCADSKVGVAVCAKP